MPTSVTKSLELARMDSPLGQLLLVLDGDQLCALEFCDRKSRMEAILEARFGKVSLTPTQEPLELCKYIYSYFAGDFDSLSQIPVSLGGTPFQQQVWSALCTIPAGTTLTYGELAAQLGNPNASRAVGLANSRNPVAIVVPCHRVVGSNAQLTGYAGGLERKRWLLEHEGVVLSRTSHQLPLALEL